MTNEYIVKHYDSYAITWFKEFNQFVITEKWEVNSATKLAGIKAKLSGQKKAQKQAASSREISIDHTSFKYHNRYEVNAKFIHLYYENEDLQTLINPKFNHLNVSLPSTKEESYFVFWKNQDVILSHKNTLLFQYSRPNLHELSGKISMMLLNTAYGRSEEDWLAVFHASFVSVQNKGVLIIGDSGSGKSTAGAILMASGMDMIADDFVPFNLNQKVNFFPAATSIKETAEDKLTDLIPELDQLAIYKSGSKDINVRYLKPRSEHYRQEFEIAAVVSIKYDEKLHYKFECLSRNEFLSALIPDTWTSPVSENVNKFMDWVLEVPAYQLEYSDNDRMIEGIKNLLDNEC